jgi:hypothetical protein
MSLYLLYKLRQFSAIGFSGFEGRHYSVFENVTKDLAEATNLQVLLTALAYKYVLSGSVTHAHIPDTPSIESERRQIFFGTAIGIPTFFVRKNTGNCFMLRVLKKTKKTRMSRRYPGYVRVHNTEYRKTLLRILKEDGRDLIDMFGLEGALRDLERRIQNPREYAASGRLTKGILDENGATSPLKLSGDEFNTMAEQYYRETLRKRHIIEACNVLLEDCREMETFRAPEGGAYKGAMGDILGGMDARAFLANSFRDMDELARNPNALGKIIHLLLLTIYKDMEKAQYRREGTGRHGSQDTPSIH